MAGLSPKRRPLPQPLFVRAMIPAGCPAQKRKELWRPLKLRSEWYATGAMLNSGASLGCRQPDSSLWHREPKQTVRNNERRAGRDSRAEAEEADERFEAAVSLQRDDASHSIGAGDLCARVSRWNHWRWEGQRHVAGAPPPDGMRGRAIVALSTIELNP